MTAFATTLRSVGVMNHPAGARADFHRLITESSRGCGSACRRVSGAPVGGGRGCGIDHDVGDAAADLFRGQLICSLVQRERRRAVWLGRDETRSISPREKNDGLVVRFGRRRARSATAQPGLAGDTGAPSGGPPRSAS